MEQIEREYLAVAKYVETESRRGRSRKRIDLDGCDAPKENEVICTILKDNNHLLRLG